MPLPWLAWTWAALAVVWIIRAIGDPSGFHAFMAITWSILAVIQLGGTFSARSQKRRRAQTADPDATGR